MLIELNDVEKVYGGSVPVRALRGVSLQLERGELALVTGPSGSGKSTLLNLLAGLDHPTSGTLRIDGTQLDQLSTDALARFRGQNIGVVFQFFQLLPTLSVVENVLLAMDLVGQIPRGERSDRAHSLLRTLGVDDQAKKRPTELSGGQRQRVAIARGMANEPAVLLADEPTGNLDQDTARRTLGVFEALRARGTTVILVTHNPAPMQGVDRHLRIADGVVSCV